MEKTTKTYREVLGFNTAALQWQKKSPVNVNKLTGFQYAIGRVMKSCGRFVEEFNDKQMDINVDAASEDEKGNILIVAGNTVFTKEASKSRNAKVRELLDAKIEVDVHFAKVIPDDLTALEIQAFEGFVIREIQEPKEK